ncbi:MAG: hypothetical protein ACI9UK_001729 [Candidatus Krumholzibacteriia bacterium]|jgi:uncharacterized protein YcbX
MIEVTGLHIYPVKSLQGISLKSAVLGVRGLQHDRMWMVIDENDCFVTQREIPVMATVKVSLSDDALILEHSTQEPLQVPFLRSDSVQREVTVWNDQCLAHDEGAEASAWLKSVLKPDESGELRLVRFHEDHIRSVDPKKLRGEDSHTGFADGFPFLITSGESLAHLNDSLASNRAARITMDRFRPNIVLHGVTPFQEDDIDTLVVRDGRYHLGLRKPCQRCSITTINQQTGDKKNPKEPLKTLTLMKTQRDSRGAFFGQNSTLLAGEGEVIKVGDELEIGSN